MAMVFTGSASLTAPGGHRTAGPVHALRSEVLADRRLHGVATLLVAVQFAKGAEHDPAVRVDQEERGPVAILHGAPVAEVAIDHHRPGDAELLHRCTYAGGVAFLRQFRRVHAHDLQAARSVLVVNGLEPAQGVAAVVAIEGPELD